MTTWKEFKKNNPLSAKAKRAYQAEREAMGVGYLILKARAKAELSQQQLAKKVGTSQPMVARWESGAQIPSVRSLLKIAEATGLDFALGLKEPGTSANSFEVLEVLRAHGSIAKGEVLKEAAG
ncbi:MAG: helix-turn-helix domain-containing protein [Actinobacteria bacterium]|nr:helix-turn-helix domain-containing protein [Actinomycetota bacterium]